MIKPTILVVEDNAICRGNIKRAIQKTYEVKTVETKRKCIQLIKKEKVDLILLDITLSDNTHLSIVNEVKEKAPFVPIIVITDDDEPETAAEVIKRGAVDYVRKSKFFEDSTTLLKKMDTVLEASRFKDISEAQKDQINYLNRHWFIPNLDSYQRPYHQAEIAIKGQLSLLVYGETGVGKNQLVSHVHQKVTPENPLITVDCGAIPKELVESELFGYEKGAFTGADISKKGKIELSNGGILFLDEISNAPLDTQVKLLRVLQEKKISRLGSTVEIPVDFTLVTATNKHLETEVKNGKFKEDLYYRIRQMETTLPALRENPKVIQNFADHFICRYNTKYATNFITSNEFFQYLTSQKWPGNLRELDAEVQKIVFAHSIGEDYRNFIRSASMTGFRKVASDEEKAEILSALKKHHYRITAAAKELNIKRTTLHSRMKKYEIRL